MHRNGIQSVAELIGNIAVSSNEQATGIAQVNQGLMQVSQVIQNNTATSEESAAASEELSSQAELLREMVGEFKLRENTKDYNSKEDNIQETHKLQETKKKAKKPSIALSDYEFGKY
jgi:methyl-accepting chemotaxis protein